MFNTSNNDLLELLSSSRLNKFSNSTLPFGGIKLDLDTTALTNILTREFFKKINPIDSSSRFNTNLFTTRLASSSTSLTTAENIHLKVDSIVARINLCQMLFGILGNFICICILMQKTLLNRRFNLYLLILALADFVFCLIVFINYYIVFTNPSMALYDLSKITCYFTDYVVSSVDAFCVFVTLILSIDRLYAIKRPIKSKMFFTYRFPKRIALFGYLLILVIKSPDLFLSQRRYYIPGTNNFTENLSPKNEGFYENKEIESDHITRESCQSTNMFDSSKENSTTHIAYIIFCNIIIPLIFNIIPAFLILILNLTLWFFMRQYSNIMAKGSDDLFDSKNLASYLNRTSRRSITTTQKSHYFTIIILGIWLLITNIPYYTLFTYYWANSLKLIQDNTRLHMTIQAISSAFFNSNHCINIIIYMIFNRDFRLSAIKILFNIFNLNPLIKLNPLYFKVTTPQSSVKVLNSAMRLKSINRDVNYMTCIDDLEEMKSLNETSIVFNQKYKSNVNKLSLDDSKSFSALNLNGHKLFVTNQKLNIFKFNRKNKKAQKKVTYDDVNFSNV